MKLYFRQAFVNDIRTKYTLEHLDQYFECKVKVPLIRLGKRQTLEILISEEALSFVKFYETNEKHGFQESVFNDNAAGSHDMQAGIGIPSS
jgi:hypothetical protein